MGSVVVGATNSPASPPYLKETSMTAMHILPTAFKQPNTVQSGFDKALSMEEYDSHVVAKIHRDGHRTLFHRFHGPSTGHRIHIVARFVNTTMYTFDLDVHMNVFSSKTLPITSKT